MSVLRRMEGDELERHARFGLATRHDMITVDGDRIPRWSEVVNVGQPEGVLVRRHHATTEVVVTRPANLLHEGPGDVYLVPTEALLVALNEVTGTCQCLDGDLRCPMQRNWRPARPAAANG
jgi:hypothetical protein